MEDKTTPDPRCGATEASVAETRGRVLHHERVADCLTTYAGYVVETS